MNEVKVGRPITDPAAGRDAVHVPVLPMIATRVMVPGEHLTNGCVDPFLKSPVQPGERYYLWLFPGTVTSLRHVWTHPAFDDEADPLPKPKAPAEPDRTYDAVADGCAKKSRSEADVWDAVRAKVQAKGAQITITEGSE